MCYDVLAGCVSLYSLKVSVQDRYHKSNIIDNTNDKIYLQITSYLAPLSSPPPIFYTACKHELF